MTKEQKELLKNLLSSALQDCKEKRCDCAIADTYHWSGSAHQNEEQISLIEETYKEIDKL